MSAKLKIFCIAALFFGSLSNAFAQLGVAFSSGEGIHHIRPYRLSAWWDVGPVWRAEKSWGLNLIWESSFAIWDGPRRADLAPDRVTDLVAVTTGPLFRWQRQRPLKYSQTLPYAELGVGLSWLSKTEIEGRTLSIHFQFEDKVGIGLRFGSRQQFDLALRAYHYSNCSIKRPNSGVNLAMVSLGYWFPVL